MLLSDLQEFEVLLSEVGAGRMKDVAVENEIQAVMEAVSGQDLAAFFRGFELGGSSGEGTASSLQARADGLIALYRGLGHMAAVARSKLGW